MKRDTKLSTLVLVMMIALLIGVFVNICFSIIRGNYERHIKNYKDMRAEAFINGDKLQNASDYLTNQVRLYSISGDITYYNNYWNEVNNLKNRDIAISNLIEMEVTEEEIEHINNSKSLSDNLIPIENEAMKAVAAGELDKARDIVHNDIYMDFKNKIDDNIYEFRAHIDSRMIEQSNIYEKKQLNLLIINGFGLSILAVIAILNYIIMKIKVLKPINIIKGFFTKISLGELNTNIDIVETDSETGQLIGVCKRMQSMLYTYIQDIAEHLEKMAQGDMTSTIKIDYIGDFEKIKESFNSTSSSFNKVLNSIKEVSRQVAGGADEIANGAQLFSQGSVEQASEIEQLLLKTSDIKNQLENSSKYSENASLIAVDSSEKLNSSKLKMQAMSSAMDNITNSTSQIKNIIKSIEDISFQTNILALNAAVEAARAGSAGLGFSVVAEEVRNLANKSSQSAKDTSYLINNSTIAVTNENKMASETLTSLNEVLSSYATIGEMIQKMSSASEQQFNSIKQIFQSIQQISAVVQTNSATSEGSAAASQELSSQAQMLKELVSKFKLN